MSVVNSKKRTMPSDNDSSKRSRKETKDLNKNKHDLVRVLLLFSPLAGDICAIVVTYFTWLEAWIPLSFNVWPAVDDSTQHRMHVDPILDIASNYVAILSPTRDVSGSPRGTNLCEYALNSNLRYVCVCNSDVAFRYVRVIGTHICESRNPKHFNDFHMELVNNMNKTVFTCHDFAPMAMCSIGSTIHVAGVSKCDRFVIRTFYLDVVVETITVTTNKITKGDVAVSTNTYRHIKKEIITLVSERDGIWPGGFVCMTSTPDTVYMMYDRKHGGTTVAVFRNDEPDMYHCIQLPMGKIYRDILVCDNFLYCICGLSVNIQATVVDSTSGAWIATLDLPPHSVLGSDGNILLLLHNQTISISI